MKRAIRLRLARACQNIPPVPPDLSAMTPDEQLMLAVKLVGHLNLLVGGAKVETAQRTAVAAAEPTRAPDPPPEAVPPAAPAKTTPVPRRPRHAGEPDPAAVPPQNQWWETMCRFRFRGTAEPHDDDPPEEDDLDDLIYGST